MTERSDQDITVEFSDNSIPPITAEWGDGSEKTPLVAVVSAVAEASETDVLELPPLSEAIDPEALNNLFTAQSETTLEMITFQYAGYDVVVRGNGQVQIRPVPKN